MSRLDSFARMQTVADAIGSAWSEIATEVETPLALSQLSGRGLTTFSLGLPRLQRHAAEMGMSNEGVAYVERRAREEYAKALAMTESPIERSMIAALITGHWSGLETIPPRIHQSGRESDELLPPGDIVIVPQMAFIKFRLDFGIVIEKQGYRKIVAVECDGAEFHRDAAQQRLRDAYLQSWDIPTFRFTGSAIHEDAIAAADSVIAQVCMWRAS